MNTIFFWPMLGAAIAIGLYYIVLFIVSKSKPEPIPVPAPATLRMAPAHSLVEIPRAPQSEIHVEYNPEDDEEEDEMIVMESEESALLKAAEGVVEQIQDVVNHIASAPPNPDEVQSKIRAILSQYSIFQNTDYYDAINTFVSVTAERDLQLQLTKGQIEALWQ